MENTPTAPLPQVTFRETVREQDAADIRRIVQDTGFFTPEEVDVAEELVREHLAHGDASGYHFIMAEQQDELVGYACYGPTPAAEGTYDLYWIAVDPARRNMGLGKQLIAATAHKVRARNGRLLFAETSGMEKYGSTRAFYTRTGFTAEAVLKDFYRPGDDKVIYRLEV
ncbi:GNAT family N-acetyltransferase [Desulfovibrio psychrotolerans]|uniref:N-acetyltransferase domain-containing protein n=1 Tax=Desulfovibrio psychrotolerans TaxID=415242 RepID=A0A7J0BT27_9BACT|nr:GNAT family N-acetyltransferase [Desulfovibrio psychrotolerans]GFM36818.1 hypothetical protein DSM19430T_15020 [Desulfovibrio psychrotolerans]